MLRFFLIFVSFLSVSAGAETTTPGEVLFHLHCAACHGKDARGSGTVGAAIKEDPADLTALSQRHGGAYPVQYIVRKIDGRAPLEAHGRGMPVYGWFFEGPPTTLTDKNGEAVETTEAIAHIVFWLERIQR
jgi:mono/diheme cytochrome c family protein